MSVPTPFCKEPLIEDVGQLAEGLGRCDETSLVLFECSDPLFEHEDVRWWVAMWPAATGACLIAGCEEVCKYQNRHLHAGSGKCEGSLAGLGAEDHRRFAR